MGLCQLPISTAMGTFQCQTLQYLLSISVFMIQIFLAGGEEKKEKNSA
jgi:hypothetical protein